MWLFFRRSSAHFQGRRPLLPFGSPYPGMCGRLALGPGFLAGTLVVGKEFLHEKRIVQSVKGPGGRRRCFMSPYRVHPRRLPETRNTMLQDRIPSPTLHSGPSQIRQRLYQATQDRRVPEIGSQPGLGVFSSPRRCGDILPRCLQSEAARQTRQTAGGAALDSGHDSNRIIFSMLGSYSRIQNPIKEQPMQFVIIARHSPEHCPTSNAKIRQLVKEGTKEIPNIAQKLGVKIVTLNVYGPIMRSWRSSRPTGLNPSVTSRCRAASCSGTRLRSTPPGAWKRPWQRPTHCRRSFSRVFPEETGIVSARPSRFGSTCKMPTPP